MLFAYLLSACSTSGSGHSEFYTWVDETGQLRTERVESEEVTSDQNTDSASPNTASEGEQKNSSVSEINPADYMPADQMDRKLRDARLFAWQDETGKQSVSEVDRSELKDSPDETFGVEVEATGIKGRRFTQDCCEQLASSDKYLLNDLAGRELKLSDYYTYQESLQSDALIFDFADFEVEDIRIKTFIKKDKLALPDILLLDERFQLKRVLTTPFSHFVEESWASYGYMQGRIPNAQLENIDYLVILPSQQVGVLELGEKKAKITDLGSIMVQRDASSR